MAFTCSSPQASLVSSVMLTGASNIASLIAVVLTEAGQPRLIRRRQTVAELLALETEGAVGG